MAAEIYILIIMRWNCNCFPRSSVMV